MTAELLRLWAAKDAAQEAWSRFADPYRFKEGDPFLAAAAVPAAFRTPEQHRLILENQERRQRLLDTVLEAERRVRVATGHATPQDLRVQRDEIEE